MKVSKVVQGITSEEDEAARSSVAIQRATAEMIKLLLDVVLF